MPRGLVKLVAMRRASKPGATDGAGTWLETLSEQLAWAAAEAVKPNSKYRPHVASIVTMIESGEDPAARELHH